MAHGKNPADARERHGLARKMLAAGVDLMEKRKAAKHAERTASAKSFATIAALWFEHRRDGKSLRHVDRLIDA